MNRADLVSSVAGSTSLSKSEAASAVRAVFEIIAKALGHGESVRIARFGTFTARNRAARQGRNPRTGETIVIASSRTPSFKAGRTLHNAVKRTPS